MNADVKLIQFVKRSAVICGRKTSITLEPQFWDALKEITDRTGYTISEQLGFIDVHHNRQGNLASAVRVYVVEWYRKQIEERIGS